MIRRIQIMGIVLGVLFSGISPADAREISPDVGHRSTPIVTAVAQATPSVVAISIEQPNYSPFSWASGGTSSSEGSGVVIDSKGIVLTNAHVVESAISIQASFSDDSVYNASIIGIVPELDLAVLQLDIPETSLPAIPIGRSRDVLLGETVIAIGNPFGLGHTVTTGVISAINRPLETENRIYQDFIQTDASINPGNSGGPLVNIDGELIGINTAIRSGAEGIGFAIPVDRAMKVAQDLLTFGRVKKPWLGVDLHDVVFRKDGRKMVAPQVSWVYPEHKQLKKGDVLLAIDDRKVQSRGDLNAYLASLNASSSVRVQVWRNGAMQELSLQMAELPESVVSMTFESILGVQFQDNSGRIITTKVKTGGAFERYRLKVGDQILAVNGQKVTSISDIETMIFNLKSAHKGAAIFTIRRGKYQGQLELPI